ncbi:hypothetical protein BGCPKDLD_5231 [Methylorubrum suomiense]|uniref:Uncharacterized protein n=1 Tax=Methylorubrum suomiense TaxID=144191 RepID=A0ABQ4V2T0_9HYPH|nr:hypothetical protein BGCPKDLD_5231 [Methylorubrum suomiense]
MLSGRTLDDRRGGNGARHRGRSVRILKVDIQPGGRRLPPGIDDFIAEAVDGPGGHGADGAGIGVAAVGSHDQRAIEPLQDGADRQTAGLGHRGRVARMGKNAIGSGDRERGAHGLLRRETRVGGSQLRREVGPIDQDEIARLQIDLASQLQLEIGLQIAVRIELDRRHTGRLRVAHLPSVAGEALVAEPLPARQCLRGSRYRCKIDSILPLLEIHDPVETVILERRVDKDIFAATACDEIATATADDDIVAGAALDVVGAGAAENIIALGRTVDRCVRGRGCDLVERREIGQGADGLRAGRDRSTARMHVVGVDHILGTRGLLERPIHAMIDDVTDDFHTGHGTDSVLGMRQGGSIGNQNRVRTAQDHVVLHGHVGNVAAFAGDPNGVVGRDFRVGGRAPIDDVVGNDDSARRHRDPDAIRVRTGRVSGTGQVIARDIAADDRDCIRRRVDEGAVGDRRVIATRVQKDIEAQPVNLLPVESRMVDGKVLSSGHSIDRVSADRSVECRVLDRHVVGAYDHRDTAKIDSVEDRARLRDDQRIDGLVIIDAVRSREG